MTSGTYGSPALVDLAMQKYRPAPRQQDYPFAMFWDQGCHHVDDLQWCFGPVAEVTARTFSAPWSRYADDAAIQVLLRFGQASTATYLLSNVARWNELRWSVRASRACSASGATNGCGSRPPRRTTRRSGGTSHPSSSPARTEVPLR